MDASAYRTPEWRALPRERCFVAELFGEAAGPCTGLIHRHHVDPDDPRSRTVEACAGHHPKVHAALRALAAEPERPRRCRRRHTSRAAREQCERRLRSAAAS